MTECFPHTFSYFTIRDRLTSLKHTYSYRAKSRENAVVQLCLFSLTNVRKRTCSFVCRGSLATNSTRSNSGWSHRHLVNKNKSEAWLKQLQHAVACSCAYLRCQVHQLQSSTHYQCQLNIILLQLLPLKKQCHNQIEAAATLWMSWPIQQTTNYAAQLQGVETILAATVTGRELHLRPGLPWQKRMVCAKVNGW